MSFSFAELSKAANSVGAKVKDLGSGCRRVIGDYAVDYFSGTGTAGFMIAGTKNYCKFVGNSADLVALAFEPPSEDGKARLVTLRTKQKGYLLASENNCRRCNTLLNIDTAYLGYIVPIFKGGFYYYDNLCLLCEACFNKERANTPRYLNPTKLAAGSEEPTVNPVKRKYGVVGYFKDSKSAFVETVEAYSVEHAVELARNNVGDPRQTDTTVIAVLVGSENIVNVLENKQTICGPVGLVRLKNVIVNTVMSVNGLVGSKYNNDVLTRVRDTVMQVADLLVIAAENTVRLQAIWDKADYSKKEA